MNTVLLKVVSAIALAGQIVPASRPGPGGLSLVEVTPDEARDLLNRGKCEVPADAELIEAGFLEAAPPAGFDPHVAGDEAIAAAVLETATPDAPVDALVQVGDATVAVQVIGQAEDGSPVVTDASGAALEAAADAAQASQDAAQAATADASTSDQPKTAEAAQGAATADKPATKPRGNKSAGK